MMEINFNDGSLRPHRSEININDPERKFKITVNDYLRSDLKSLISGHTPCENVSEEEATIAFDRLIIDSERSAKRGHMYRIDMWDEDEEGPYVCESIWIIGTR